MTGRILVWCVAAGIFGAMAGSMWLETARAQDAPVDYATWGDDHVGKSLPMLTEGGECLFCHRGSVGSDWESNRHGHAMSEAAADSPAIVALKGDAATADVAKEVQYLVGHTRQQGFLKPNGKYGQMAMLDVTYDPQTKALTHGDTPTWNPDMFANECAGCHASAVETEYKAFTAVAHDCYVCHGVVAAKHNEDVSLAIFGKGNGVGPVAEMAVCASCHLRGGYSKSTGLPYANQFIAGDNLFKDFEADLSEEHIATLNIADRHVFQNVRDVVLLGRTDMTCMTCHDIHASSSREHRTLKRLQREQYCAMCHSDLDDYTKLVAYDVDSDTCGY